MANGKTRELALAKPERRHLRPSAQTLTWIVLATVTSLVSIAAALNGTSTFAWDSWSYFELSKTVFSAHFYHFNTYRSYFSDDYSAAFPFGYPVVIALVQLGIGQTPMAAVITNIVVMAVTWMMITRLVGQLGLPTVARCAFASGFVLWAFYLDEVFAGRSGPLALLFVLFALSACLSMRFLLAGVCLGLATLVRFDYLVHALVFYAVACSLLFSTGRKKKIFVLGLGLLVGIIPWILYSQIRFGSIWVSDKAWVALSAAPANFTDFPAKPLISLVENPVMWALRVFYNIVPLARSIAYSLMQFPMAILIWLYFLLSFRQLSANGQRISILLFIALVLTLIPNLLTGDYNPNDYTPVFLCTCGVIAYTIQFSPSYLKASARFNAVLLISLFFSVGLGLHYLAKRAVAGIERFHDADIVAQYIEALRMCHEKMPAARYIFIERAAPVALRYGAVTGYRTAYIPSNFKKMPAENRLNYFQHMKPYAIIDIPSDPHACPVVH